MRICVRIGIKAIASIRCLISIRCLLKVVFRFNMVGAVVNSVNSDVMSLMANVSRLTFLSSDLFYQQNHLKNNSCPCNL